MAKSSGVLMGATIRSTVRKAAKLAVYEDINMIVKNHQTAAAILPAIEGGVISHPCCIKAAKEYQKEFSIVNSLGGTGGTCACGSLKVAPPIIPGGCWAVESA